MSVRIRELATCVASCAVLLPAGCRRAPAELTVDPEAGGEPVVDTPAPDCDCEAAQASSRPKPGSSGDAEAPVVLGARFVARDRVQLTFSEGLAPTESVNPRQFRLSMAYSMLDYGSGYATGYYYDLAGSDNYELPFVVTSLEGYEDRPEVLALTLSRPVPVELCADIEDMRADLVDSVDSGGRGQVGLFLHYTTRGSVGIRDLAENPLGDMGGEWALHFGARHKTMYGTEPVMRLDLLVELACPDERMGMSAPPGPG
ncbi:hypothetical protein [Enhygromyxa salina]|nr:hypothetical protein [Enhygromyxa salina]